MAFRSEANVPIMAKGLEEDSPLYDIYQHHYWRRRKMECTYIHTKQLAAKSNLLHYRRLIRFHLLSRD